MDRTKMSAVIADKDQVTVWLTASCKKDRQFLEKIIGLFAKEVQTRVMINGDWDVSDLVEVGGELMEFLNSKTNEAEDAEFDAFMEESGEFMEEAKDETTA